MTDRIILRAIPGPEEYAIDFGRFCKNLGSDKPKHGEGKAWHELFLAIERLEAAGFIATEREEANERGIRTILSIQLTDAGLTKFRELKGTA